MSSPYMQWAKSHTHVEYNLASSGMTNYPLAKLPVKMGDLEITGDSYYGYPPLMEALSKHCGVPTDHIVATIGTSMANFVAMAALVEPGDEILLEEPTYELLLSAAQFHQASVRRFTRRAENGFMITVEDVDRALTSRTKLIVITNLHNPSSALTDEKTLLEIGEVARGVGARVLVDEVYLDAVEEKRPRTAIHLGKEFIVTNSLTKIYGLSGLRCGWVLAEPELIQKMWHLIDLMYGIPAHPSERMSVIALKNLPAIYQWSKKILDENHRLLKQHFLQRDDIELQYHGMGTVVFPKLKNGSVEKLYRLLMERYKTAIAPGKYFEMPEYFRIGLGGKPEMFQVGLKNLCAALDEFH